jgi:hypothetical protein
MSQEEWFVYKEMGYGSKKLKMESILGYSVAPVDDPTM